MFWKFLFCNINLRRVFFMPGSLVTTTAIIAAAAVGAKNALNAKHTASRTKLASHAQRAKDVPVNFS
jgi:hypothetical protein